MGVWYATREDVKGALDYAETARSDRRVDQAIEAASRWIEGFLHRRFYPEIATRYFDYPGQYARPWRLWLDDSELISLTSISSGGVTIDPATVFLEPNRSGPPYNRVELNIGTNSAFGGGQTTQRDITITGLWGYNSTDTAAAAAAAPAGSTDTTLTVGPADGIGVGQVLRVGSERMLVTGRSMADTGQTLQTPLDAQQKSVSVAVSDGTGFEVGEVLLLDSERMLVVDIAGNQLTVKRAWDGSVPAAHTGSAIYALRRLTVTRGALGTTAATISQGDTVYRWEVPGPVRTLCIAEALVTLMQQSSGYARTTGVGSSARQVGGGTIAKTQYGLSIESLREQAYTSHGRKARMRAV
ncbi:hypothetical protein [Kitasatospora cineracea]|uniref:Uncharacterized protein n=1 Tax=Kitasatospora cineracea TaxID=88074 RepID=A0A3N4RV31_9ACTN|nr:hypothetical protein [Kitasatospora cineracea]RPE34919.1 hypothetical protein EDD38_3261 [Kitasatospora cineracea]